MGKGLRFANEAALPPRMRELLAAQQGGVESPVIVMDVPVRCPLQNTWQRMHWAKRRLVCREWAQLLFAAHPRLPATPITRCLITIERFSTQKPDRDGRYGGVKPILDALQPTSKRHPYGLGFIVDDNDECVTELKVIHVQSREQRTRIIIQPVSE